MRFTDFLLSGLLTAATTSAYMIQPRRALNEPRRALNATKPAHKASAERLAAAAPGECTFWAAPEPGDTCQSFADWWIVPLDRLRLMNPGLNCPTGSTPIFAGTEWCVEMPELPSTTTTSGSTPTSTTGPTVSPTQPNVTKDCKAWYKVVSGDGCQIIVDRYKTFTLQQFYSWNPDVGSTCGSLQLDTYVCVGVTGTPTSPPATTATPTDPNAPPSPTQPNVTKDCKAWYKVVPGDGCQVIVDRYKTFTLQQFYSWNPDVGSTCASLQLDTYVCVGVTGTPSTSATPTGSPLPSPTQPNVSKDCQAWYKVVAGDGCQVIVDRFKTFTLAQFYSWNPDVGSTCSGLPLDAYVCVGVTGTPTSPTTTPTPTGSPKPSPTQPNVTKDCKAWYKVVSGDGCQKIVDSYRTFTLAQFYSWNPDVGNTCGGLLLDTYVCVGVTGTPTSPPATTTTKPPSPTVTGTTPPTPTQSGVSKTCNKWYYVVTGDQCNVIASRFSITPANFFRWNPVVNSACTNLQTQVYVCVGST